MGSNDHASMGQSTLCIHSHNPEDWLPYKPMVTPIVLTASYKYNTPTELPEILYERYGNPTRNVVQKTVADLEGAEYALCFASGMTAAFASYQLLKPGDAIICSNQVYGGVALYFDEFAPSKGLEVTYVDAVGDPENVRRALKKNTKMVWMEICGNPGLGILDMEKVAEIVSSYSKDIILVVDNTFLTPCIIKPLSMGATIVMQSMTKYMGGHGDMVMGCLSTNRKDLYDVLFRYQKYCGLMAPPLECFLMSRSLKTLKLRLKQHCANAMTVAQYLEAHPDVQKVLYPGLPSHPQHERAKKMLSSYGGMVSGYLKGGLEEVTKFVKSLKLVTCAVSLGSTESLICIPWLSSHHMLPEETRRSLGVTENMFRLSVGLEDIEDLLEDLKHALQAMKEV